MRERHWEGNVFEGIGIIGFIVILIHTVQAQNRQPGRDARQYGLPLFGEGHRSGSPELAAPWYHIFPAFKSPPDGFVLVRSPGQVLCIGGLHNHPSPYYTTAAPKVRSSSSPVALLFREISLPKDSARELPPGSHSYSA